MPKEFLGVKHFLAQKKIPNPSEKKETVIESEKEKKQRGFLAAAKKMRIEFKAGIDRTVNSLDAARHNMAKKLVLTAIITMLVIGAAMTPNEALADLSIDDEGDSPIVNQQDQSVRKPIGEGGVYKIPEKENDLEKIEDVRRQFLQHIKSQDYFKKLLIEFDGDEKRAKKEQDKRIRNVESVKTEIASEEKMIKKIVEIGKKKNIPMEEKDVRNDFYRFGGYMGFYDNHDHEIFINKGVLRRSNLSDIVSHEFSHASTRNKYNFEATKKVKRLLREVFSGNGERAWNEYAGNPEEILAFKKIFERELERLGIKKYGEKTTDEHIEKIMENFKDGQFSTHSELLLRALKRPELLKRFLDEIALNIEDKTEQIV